ncbi:unnamed protein product [Rhodiola kirilowii]
MLLTTPNHFTPSSYNSSVSPSSSSLTRKSIIAAAHFTRRSRTRATLITNPDAFEVGRLIGTYGFINVTRYLYLSISIYPIPFSIFLTKRLFFTVPSYKGLQAGNGVDTATADDVGRLKVQDVGEGSIKIRLYEGRMAQGPHRGTPLIFKVYPGKRVAGVEADMMAANELNAHAYLQEDSIDHFQNIQILLGGFETSTGEQWLAFRDYGRFSAADYSKIASEKISRTRGENTWNQFETQQRTKRKRLFIQKLLYGTINGIAFMHDLDRLHQSVGPASIVLNTITEREAAYVIPRLRDLAFSVDIRYSSLIESPDVLSEALWRRANNAGVYTPAEKRVFGIADDMYEVGLLFAYLAFVPFCEAGIMDGLSLQRLLENTFQLDLEAMREYCLADDKLADAVDFLDLGDGAGWELLQAMLNSDFRKRPTARDVLKHQWFRSLD